jgi:Polyketide cyclase / dehydrase and lipid transport
MKTMAEAVVQDDVAAGVEEVWKVVSDFPGVIAIMGVPVESEGEGIGMTRSVAMGESRITERLESLDPATYSTSYSIVSGPIPVREYLSTIRLASAGDAATRITWSGRFEPDGISDADAVKMIEQVYAGGIKAIQKHFTA